MKKIIFSHLAFILILAVYILLTTIIFGYSCPFYIIFKINCPFCGMTRAHLAFLTFNFKEAIYYHPVFFLGIPFLFLIIHNKLPFLKDKEKYNYIRKVLVICISIILITVYVLRVINYGFAFFN